MNRTIIKSPVWALVVGLALIWLGVWRTSQPIMLSDVALPKTWSTDTLERDGVSVALEVRPLAAGRRAARGWIRRRALSGH